MKQFQYKDKEGKIRTVLAKDTDSLQRAIEFGLPQDPPDLSKLNFAQLEVELHNELVKRGLITHQDVVNSQNGVTTSILAVFKRKVINLYREESYVKK